MAAMQIVGAALVALPFVALFVAFWREEGLVAAITVYVGVAAVIGLVALGATMMLG